MKLPPTHRPRLTRFLTLGALFAMAGCAGQPRNPTFPLSIPEARADLRRMRAAPARLARPVLVAGGYLDPGFAPREVAQELRRVTRSGPSEPAVRAVSMWGCASFAECGRRLAKAAGDGERAVDVVGISMGGLVARHAAAARAPGRIRIARLFTIATPHRGARLAGLPTLDARQRQMRPRSPFLRRLEATERDYPILPYARLGDGIVGTRRTAPRGDVPWWLPTPLLGVSHLGAPTDPRILADIARRLRGEAPFTRTPRAPLPKGRK